MLDIAVKIEDDVLLVKYNLESNGQKEVSLEELSKLIGDAKARYGRNLLYCSCRSIDLISEKKFVDTQGQSHIYYRYKTMKFSLGGSSLNSSRILSAMGQKDLLFYGAIGDDQNGKIVKEILKRSAVNAQ